MSLYIEFKENINEEDNYLLKTIKFKEKKKNKSYHNTRLVSHMDFCEYIKSAMEFLSKERRKIQSNQIVRKKK